MQGCSSIFFISLCVKLTTLYKRKKKRCNSRHTDKFQFKEKAENDTHFVLLNYMCNLKRILKKYN